MKIVPMLVTYLDHMGTDLTVVDAARVSFDKESEWELAARPPSSPEYPYEDTLKEADAKLISYLAKHNHWSPFAHTSIQLRVKAPIFVARQLVKHCVTGDTLVSFCKPVKGRSNGIKRRPISELYEMWSGKIKYQGGKKGKRNVSGGHVKVFNEQTQLFESSHIVDVIYQGVKPVFWVTTLSGQRLRATANHEVMTQRGWVAVSDLVVGSDSMVSEVAGMLVNSNRANRDNDSEAVIARREFVKDECVGCGSIENLECDHIVPVSQGGSHAPHNLQCLCADCHKRKSANEKVSNPDAFRPRYTEVASVVEAGSEDVYDLTIDGTHNFLANGLVVHNCVGGVWNEVSRRYVDSEPEFYFPEVWRGRPVNAKQGSSGDLEKEHIPEHIFGRAMQECVDAYNVMLNAGVAPEQARMVLPQNMHTEWIWTGSLMFFCRVCRERLAPGAQQETREVAEQIAEIVAPLFPVSWVALMDKE